MKNQLLDKGIENMIDEVNLYRWIMIASIVLVFILIIIVFILVEDKKDLQEQIEMLANSNQSLLNNLAPKP